MAVTFESFRDDLRAAARALPANLVVLDSIESTNSLVRRVVLDLPPEVPPVRTFFVAREQTGGRGRLGRAWRSPAGRGLYCTLLEPLAGPEEAALLPAAVAVALCRTCVEAGAAECRIKWPNDLLVGTRKLAGILIEVAGRRSGAGSVAIVGFGINLGSLDAPTEALGATTLEGAGASPISAGDLLVLAARHLESLVFDRTPDREVVAAYRELLKHRSGDEIAWRQGSEVVRGRFAGVDDSGRLLLDTVEGRRAVAVGDIIEP